MPSGGPGFRCAAPHRFPNEVIFAVTVVLDPVEAPRYLGQPVLRREDRRLLVGRGRFIADLSPMGHVCTAAILRSPHAHALIRGIRVDAALALDGVVGVLVGTEVARLLRPFPLTAPARMTYYPCAVDRVRYVGEPVAVVVARDRYVAEDALERIEVDYEPLPAVTDAEAAMAPGAPLLHPEQGSNVAHHRTFCYGDPDGAFATADLVVRGRYAFPRVSAMPMETYGVIAHYDPAEDVYTIWANFHGPFTLHSVLAHSLGVPANRLRVVVPPDIGGSFGIKAGLYPYMALLAAASRRFGVAVKWVEDRLEHLAASSAAAERVAYIEAAARADGRITALRLRFIDNVGAYMRPPEPACLYRTHGNLTGPYDIRHVALETYAVVTNKCPTALNRGYGGPQHAFPIERVLDRVAQELGLDPAEVRRRNLIRQDQFPYRTATGGLYDSGQYEAALDKALELIGYEELRRQQRHPRPDGRRLGIGLACVVEPSGSNMGYVTLGQTPAERAQGLPKSGCVEAVSLAVDPSGTVTVRLSTTPQGQGHETVAAQVVAEELGIDPDQVQVVAGMDTFTLPWTVSSGSYSSRFAPLTASALMLACRRLKERLVAVAAHLLDVPADQVVWRGGGALHPDHPDRFLSLRRLAGTVHWNPASLPPDLEPNLEVTVRYSLPVATAPDDADRVDSSATYGFVADAVAVLVDPATGEVEVLRCASVHDAGRILNPMLANGQIYGGAVHGLGMALYEELRYSPDGQLLTATFMDYLCPTAAEVPPIQIAHVESPSPLTLSQAKGLGEGSTISLPSAIANAVADALGVDVAELPLSPMRVWAMARGIRGEVGR